MKLIQLPSGEWVSPRVVSAVVPLPEYVCQFTGVRFRARVAVHAGRSTAIILCNDDEDAVGVARDLAEKINAAEEEAAADQ